MNVVLPPFTSVTFTRSPAESYLNFTTLLGVTFGSVTDVIWAPVYPMRSFRPEESVTVVNWPAVYEYLVVLPFRSDIEVSLPLELKSRVCCAWRLSVQVLSPFSTSVAMSRGGAVQDEPL